MRAARIQGPILERLRFEIRNLSPALAFAMGTARGSASEEVEYYKVRARWVSKSLTGLHNKTDNVRLMLHSGAFAFPILPWESSISTYSVSVFIALCIQHSKRMGRVILLSVACPAVQYFSTLSHKRYDFSVINIIEHIKCVLISSTNFV
jgi:hypothetical protein